MLLHPAVMALLGVSVLTSLMLLYSAFYGIQILRQWDLGSGSEQQLTLERETYLISVILAYAFGFQLLSLFLFMFTADNLHVFFVGAMCAAGTLHVNGYGYPALVLKIVNFLAAGIWLIINYTDNRAYDYPLIRKKYLFLLVITPMIILETLTMAGYLLGLKPDIITSCCGSLFTADTRAIGSEIVLLPAGYMKMAFYLTVAACVTSGLYFYRKGRGSYLFSFLTAGVFLISIFSVISFISPYIYELPTHHCPFCLLQKEYSYIGYPLYVSLLGGGVTGIGAGILSCFRGTKTLSSIIPPIQKKLVITSVILYLIFTAVVAYAVFSSSLIIQP